MTREEQASLEALRASMELGFKEIRDRLEDMRKESVGTKEKLEGRMQTMETIQAAYHAVEKYAEKRASNVFSRREKLIGLGFLFLNGFLAVGTFIQKFWF